MYKFCKVFGAVLTSIFLATTASANNFADGYVQRGGNSVSTAGFQSTTKVQKSFPGATVTVYLRGTTTLATIFSDAGGTAKANPFTADTAGYYFFWTASHICFDLKFSGTGITTPWTLPNVCPVSVTGSATFYNIQDYGATPDDASDDTAAIRTAISAATANGGGAIYIPAGNYAVESLVGPIFSPTIPLTFFGDGRQSRLSTTQATCNTCDVFYYNPASAVYGDGIVFRDFVIDQAQIIKPGRHGIFIDASGSGDIARKFNIEHMWIFGSANGDCVKLDSTVSGGGLGIFTDVIQRSFFDAGGATTAGLRLVNALDSISVVGNTYTGLGYGVNGYFYAAGGAGSFNFNENNVTAKSGMHFDDGIYKATFDGNYFEFNQATGAFTGSNSAMFDMNGAGAGFVFNTPTFSNNLFSVIGAAGIDDLRLNQVTNPILTANVFLHIAGRSGVVLTANTVGAVIKTDNTFGGGGTNITSAAPGYSLGEPWVCSTISSSAAITNTATPTVFSKKCTIPAGFLQTGDVVEIVGLGIYQTNGTTPTIKLDLLLQGTQFATATLTAANTGGVNTGWNYRAGVIFQSVGAAGTVRAMPDYMGIGVDSVLGGHTANTRNTNNTIDLEIQMTWGAAALTNTITMQGMVATVRKAYITVP